MTAMRRVVDTNVAVVANGRNTNASLDCRQRAVEFIVEFLQRGRVILDRGGEIQAEYHKRLNPRGQPGVGDRFYLVVLQSSLKRVERINLPKGPATDEFVDFPDDTRLANFDRNDRKFAAAARKAGVPVANAADTDWLDHETALRQNGVQIQFICGMDRAVWFE